MSSESTLLQQGPAAAAAAAALRAPRAARVAVLRHAVPQHWAWKLLQLVVRGLFHNLCCDRSRYQKTLTSGPSHNGRYKRNRYKRSLASGTPTAMTTTTTRRIHVLAA